jgi:hypothetical protein
MQNKSKILLGSTFTAMALILSSEMAVGKDLKEVCSSPNSNCDALSFTSNFIEPTYDRTEENARKQIEDLGWEKESTHFLDPKSFAKADGSRERVDAQAIISKQVIAGKTYYMFSFRGTESSNLTPDLGGNAIENALGNDVVTDLQFQQTSFPRGKVHSGFLKYTNAIYLDPKVQDMLQEIIRDNTSGKPYEVLVTGHSLGGAAATVFSAILQTGSSLPKSNIKTVVFGAPSPGNKEFVENYLSDVIKAEIPLDIVPDSTKLLNKGVNLGNLSQAKSDGLPLGA